MGFWSQGILLQVRENAWNEVQVICLFHLLHHSAQTYNQQVGSPANEKSYNLSEKVVKKGVMAKVMSE